MLGQIILLIVLCFLIVWMFRLIGWVMVWMLLGVIWVFDRIGKIIKRLSE